MAFCWRFFAPSATPTAPLTITHSYLVVCMPKDNHKEQLVDWLASKMLGERLPIDFADIPRKHKIQMFHLNRMADALIESQGNPCPLYMPPSILRNHVLEIYKHVTTITNN